jgi:predicted MPP superfamily phosphohydrolase
MNIEIWLMLIITMLLFFAAALFVMIRQASKLKITEADFTKEGKEPVRFVLISDLHISLMPIHWDYICTNISKAQPDFVVVAGDLIFKKKDGGIVLSFFEMLAGYVSCPVYVVYGNHDNNKLFEHDDNLKKTFTETLEAISSRIKVIENKSVVFTKNEREIHISGTKDFRSMTADTVDFVKNELADARTGGRDFILVTHNPGILEILEENTADLVVAGHYHDGQVYLPLRTEFGILRRKDKLACKGVIYGKHIYKKTPLYITSGLGNTNLAIRYKSTPEIAVIYM